MQARRLTRNRLAKQGDEIRPVSVVAEEPRPLDPPHHQVMERARHIE